MAIPFNPPDWLIQEYLNRKQPAEIANEGIQQGLQTYVQMKQQQQAQASLDAQRKAQEFKAIADYVPEAQIPALAKQYGLNIPPAGNVPPTVSSSTVAGEAPAQPSSPVIDHAIASGFGQAPTSKAGLAKFKTNLETQKLQKDLLKPDKGPLQTLTKEQALAAGSYDPTKQYIVEPPAAKDTTIQDQKREDRLAKAVTDYGKQIENHPVIRKLNDQQIGINQVDDMLHLVQSGNTVASSAMGTKMARAMGEVGVLTESDIKRYVQSGKLTQGAADKLSKWIIGRPTEATIQEIGQISTALKDSFASKVQPIYDRHINRFSRAYKVDPQEAAYLLAIPYSGEKPEGETTVYSDAQKEARYQAWKARQIKP